MARLEVMLRHSKGSTRKTTMRCAFLIPGHLGLPTGGYAYDRRLLEHLPSLGIDIRHVELPSGYPAPSPSDLEATVRIFEGLEGTPVLMVDGLAFGAMPVDVIERIPGPIVALCHHPLALESGLSPDRAAALARSETEALAHAAAVVVTSSETKAILVRDFAAASQRITVAEPGTDPAPRAEGTGSPVELVAVGSVVPRKGYDVLLDALGRIRSATPWHLTIAGADDRAPEESERLRQLALPLGERVTFAGAVSSQRLEECFRRADIFVMSSHYEGYGMALMEAMARGLPIVTTECGAAARSAPERAAIRVAPNDADALSKALARMIDDTGLRSDMAKASWLAGQQLPRWTQTARIVSAVLRRVAR